MKSSTEIKDLAAALAQAQAELKAPPKDKINPHFRNKYADLATIIAAVQPILAKHGLSISQLPEAGPAGITLETVLMHKSGQWISSTISMPAEKPNAQGLGSALTYARRYALSAIVSVAADEDDDGNAASAGNGKHAPAAHTVPEGSEALAEELKQAMLAARDYGAAEKVASGIALARQANKITSEQAVALRPVYLEKLKEFKSGAAA